MAQWKQIKGYEGIYSVSDEGEIVREQYSKTMPNGSIAIMPRHKIKSQIGTNGYLYVCLSKEGKHKRLSVHRIVAVAFIDNPNNLPEVNHKDQNRQNAKVANLEWCSRIQNVRHGTGIEKQRISNSKSIDRYTMDGEYIDTWLNEKQYTKSHGINGTGLIRKVCDHYHGYSSAYGYKWKWHNDKKEFNKPKRGKVVAQFDKSGNYIKSFQNSKKAELETGINHCCIRKCMNGQQLTAGGFIWKHEE